MRGSAFRKTGLENSMTGAMPTQYPQGEMKDPKASTSLEVILSKTVTEGQVVMSLVHIVSWNEFLDFWQREDRLYPLIKSRQVVPMCNL